MVENVKELLKLHEGITHEVYLDNENSSIVPQEIVDAMLPYWNKKAYGNPTLTHKPGWEAFEVIMNCFQKISKTMGSKNLEDITFTPGETEANNLILMYHHLDQLWVCEPDELICHCIHFCLGQRGCTCCPCQ
jgi:cysteine desulfurase